MELRLNELAGHPLSRSGGDPDESSTSCWRSFAVRSFRWSSAKWGSQFFGVKMEHHVMFPARWSLQHPVKWTGEYMICFISCLRTFAHYLHCCKYIGVYTFRLLHQTPRGMTSTTPKRMFSVLSFVLCTSRARKHFFVGSWCFWKQ